MHIVVIQLSDLHIRSADDLILRRGQKLADAINSLSYEAGACIIALTGDIADSGEEHQYDEAIIFVNELKDLISRSLVEPKRLQCVAVPGNHDCDLTGTGTARPTIIAAISAKASTSVDESEVEICTASQNQFFRFLEAVTGTPSPLHRLYYEHSLDLGSAGSLLFRCCNTSWISVMHERPGTLHYPVDQIPQQRHHHDLVVTLLHHPYDWFLPVTRRGLRHRLEEVSDVLLTGHEHHFSARSNIGWAGEHNLYIEGGALQGHRGAERESTFNVILLDVQKKLQKIVTLSWDGEMYRPTDRGWELYQMNQLRSAHLVSPNEAFLEWLSDPGVVLEHPARGRLTLHDIFVYPDLREAALPRREAPPAFSSKGLLEKARDLRRILVTGSDKAGKTSLSKRLFIDALAAGYVPVIVEGARLRGSTSDAVVAAITKAFDRAYSSKNHEQYRQLEPSRRVIIVDDFHRAEGIKGSVKSLVDVLGTFASQVILVAGDLAQHLRELTEPDAVTVGRGKFVHYRILPYLHARRNELIERWCALDPSLVEDAEALAHKLVGLKRTVDTAIGTNFMPSYPIFVLPLLQAQEHGQPVDLNASTVGYYYELLIRTALAKGSSKEGFDVKLGYLAYVAFGVFSRGLDELTDADMRHLHSEYEHEHLIDVPFIPLHAQLSKSEVLVSNDEGTKHYFAYPYIYYYFVASYMRDHITDEGVRRQIAELCGRLHEERAANIMLFLAHVSKDPFVVAQLVDAAKSRFAGVERATLSRDEQVWKALDQSLDELSFVDRGDGHGRRFILAGVDAEAASKQEPAEELRQSYEGVQDLLSALGVAYKTLQILGQVVRNFPGSLDGATKKQIVSECYGVGLRSLMAVLDMIEKSGDEFVKGVVVALQDADGRLDDETLSQKARDSVYALMNAISYATIRRIAGAVGSARLSKVYDVIAKESESTAVDLIQASLNLDYVPSFPERSVIELYEELRDNIPAQNVLRTMVVGHLYMFDVRFEVKQRVCERLGISYKRVQLEGHRSRLLNSPESSG